MTECPSCKSEDIFVYHTKSFPYDDFNIEDDAGRINPRELRAASLMAEMHGTSITLFCNCNECGDEFTIYRKT